MISTFGSWIVYTGLILMIVNLFRSAKKGEKAPKNPWNGLTLEWQTDSPPTLENFEELPHVTEIPYEYAKHFKNE